MTRLLLLLPVALLLVTTTSAAVQPTNHDGLGLLNIGDLLSPKRPIGVSGVVASSEAQAEQAEQVAAPQPVPRRRPPAPQPRAQPQPVPEPAPQAPPPQHPQSVDLCGDGNIDLADHAMLFRDIELLSFILNQVVERENPRIQSLYHQFRQLGIERGKLLREANNEGMKPLHQMVGLAKTLSAQDAKGVMRVFSMALNLVNAAEVHHRLRSTSQQSGPLPLTNDSMGGTLDALLQRPDLSADDIYNQLVGAQHVEIVLTAHPTEVNRRTHLRKYRKISELLGYIELPSLKRHERNLTIIELQRIISSLWGCDEIRRTKPTPQQEALGGSMAIIESVLWEAIPAYLRKLDLQVQTSLGKKLPIDFMPIRFASWIGGDRDGNAFVTPKVTKEVVLMQRLAAAKLLQADLADLYGELAISLRFSPQMEILAGMVKESKDQRELYRRVIGHLRKRLKKTIAVCEDELGNVQDGALDSFHTSSTSSSSGRRWEEEAPLWETKDIMDPLKIMYKSLESTGFELVADGLLLDIIRRVATFGLTLAPLDIREESTKHSEALDAITRYLGVGTYRDWDEVTKLSFLQTELAGKRPLIRARDIYSMGFDKDVINTLETFVVASTLGPESLGAYVISQAQTASDVLAVMLLQKQFGMTAANGNSMRVVPLFETLNDLTNAPETLQILFGMMSYVGAIKSRQEIMVGYSDSAKDAGRLAASWAQYTAQERMAAIAKKFNVELTFFHGKGGTVGRGGNPSVYRAILSHPPDTIDGRFRVTEQGEMITKNFGSSGIAERTMDIYTAAVLQEAFTKHVQPTHKWRHQMERISRVSCADYRHLVREEPRFVPYFRQATPELELSSLNIGSRPAKRNPTGGVESLRAIPWTFSWAQQRSHLSAWLGVGAGLTAETEADLVTLREMYTDWPWFRENIDLIAMILSKTDFSIAQNYDVQLVDKTKELMGLGKYVRSKLVQTRQSVLDVTQSPNVAGAHVALLRASSTIRNPYVDPINVVQAELLKRIRMMDTRSDATLSDDEMELKRTLQDALVVSINGIAEGMRNSG